MTYWINDQSTREDIEFNDIVTRRDSSYAQENGFDIQVKQIGFFFLNRIFLLNEGVCKGV